MGHYVGARYVPKFANPLEWAENTAYEAMTVVSYNNNSYTSKVPVPPTVGNPANNPQYWVLTGNYNAQVESYRQEVHKYTNIMNDTMLSFESLTEAQNFANSNNIAVGEVIVINAKPYIVSNEPANNMDIIALTDALTATLVIYDFLKPEDIGYISSMPDASPYINRCLTLCRNAATVILSGTYSIQTTIHASYADNIYIVGTASIETNVSPAIAFDVEDLTADNRMRSPFSGNNLRIFSADRQLHNNSDWVGIELVNAELVEISNVNIYYMGSAISVEGNNNYGITFTHCLFERNYNGIYWNAKDNSGEKIGFNDCIFGHLYHCMYINTPSISSVNYINTSFDFCANGIYEVAAAPGNHQHLFTGCHIEGLGYHGSDMPFIQTDERAKFIYVENSTYTTERYTFNTCVFHVSQMQDELGLPLMVHNPTSETTIINCTLSNKVLPSLTLYPFSNGYCDKGIYNDAKCAYIGTKFLPMATINGTYQDTGTDSITISHNSEAGNFDLLYNHGEVVFPQVDRFIIDVEITDASIAFNNYYNFTTPGKTYIKLRKNAVLTRFNLDKTTSKIVFNGIYPLC